MDIYTLYKYMQVEASVTENLHKDVKTVVICDTKLNFD